MELINQVRLNGYVNVSVEKKLRQKVQVLGLDGLKVVGVNHLNLPLKKWKNMGCQEPELTQYGQAWKQDVTLMLNTQKAICIPKKELWFAKNGKNLKIFMPTWAKHQLIKPLED